MYLSKVFQLALPNCSYLSIANQKRAEEEPDSSSESASTVNSEDSLGAISETSSQQDVEPSQCKSCLENCWQTVRNSKSRCLVACWQEEKADVAPDKV